MLRFNALLIVTLLSTNVFAGVNFTCSDNAIAAAAEDCRVASAMRWVGYILPDWPQPCSIEVRDADHTGSGYTKFTFREGEATNFTMLVEGSRHIILEDVLPHEVDHAVRASIVGRPITRWVDEGSAQLVESEAAKARFRDMLSPYVLKPVPLSHLDAKEYPEDAGTFYLRAFSWCEYLQQLRGDEALIAFQKDARPPTEKLQEHYGMQPKEFVQSWRSWYQSPQPYQRTTRVVAFVYPDGKHCLPCKLLKRDIANGKFPGFDFEFVMYDPDLKVFDKPEVYDAFRDECELPRGGLGVPTIWIPGTGKFQEGYQEPPSMLRWMRDMLRFLVSPIIGPPPRLPATAGATNQATPPTAIGSTSELAMLRAQVKKAAADAQELIRVATELKTADTLGKMQQVPKVLEDVEQLKTSLTEVRGTVGNIRENPTKTLFGLITGFLSGLVHFIPRKKEE